MKSNGRDNTHGWLEERKIIIIALLAALIITVAGTFFQINNFLESNGNFLTGAASANATGITTLTISSSTSISNRVANIAFGSGYVNATGCGGRCVMDSNGQHNQTGACCVGFLKIKFWVLLVRVKSK